MASNKDVCERLLSIESRLPRNGELKEIHDDVKEIKRILLDPEDGIIVRVNQNTYWRRQLDVMEIKSIITWKSNMNKAIWIAYAAIVGMAVKLIFF